MTARAAHTPVAVLGAGSWGTALAIQFARGGRAVRLWSRDAAQLAAMAHSRRNAHYLPESPFPASLAVEADLAAAVAGSRDVLVVVPSPAFRAVLGALAPHLTPAMHVAWATKGFELASGLLPHQVAREVLGPGR
ncbi:MAG TPA: 2-dehydropantoate 2-reductase N-terminal domain-containing protein, partial [Steroidobacteraceae bacterium]|nr:2-dehydropantoate 2-reductase N-terminal domain-containing protein [Steroidobacteraceae bacterium]